MTGKIGWYSNDGVKVEGENDVDLSNGEAILVNNMYKSMPVLFQVSGEVDLVCKNAVPAGYALFGNSTPVSIKLSEVVVLHQDGEEFGTSGSRRCNGAVKINKINTEGNYTDTYSYYTMSGKLGWYKNDGTKIEGENEVEFEPGEAFLVNNMYKNMPVILSLPTPLK